MSSPFRLTLVDPSRAMTVAADLLSPMRHLSKLVLPAAALAAIAGYFNWYDLVHNLELTVRTFSFLQNLVISMLTANLLSRLVMGITMAGHGIAPPAFGIRLLLGVIPRFFVATGRIGHLDFPDQRRCYAAPLMARLSLFWIGVLTWVLLRRSGSGVADAALVLGATGLGSFLFTLNPIWRADGYHWMAARFRMPDLRERSYRLLGLVLRRRPVPETLSRREIYGLLFYALASIVFTAGLIYVLLSTVAYLLEQQFRGAGVVMFALILSMMLAFVLDRFNRKAGKRAGKNRGHRRPAGRALAQISHPRAVSCYKPVSNGRNKLASGGPDEMARNTARKLQDKSRENSSRKMPEVDSILSDTADDGAASPPGGEGGGSNNDAELDAILGPSTRPGPEPGDEFDEFLDAVLSPAPPPREPGANAGSAGSARAAPGRRDLPVPVPNRQIASVSPDRATPPATTSTPTSDALDVVLKLDRTGRKPISRSRKLLVWSVILGALWFAAIQPYPFTVGGDFIIQPVDRTEVRARTEGEIVQLSVGEGDWVNETEVMAVLSNWSERRDIAVLQADLARLDADLETLTADPKPEEIDLAKQDMLAAKTKMALMQQDLERKQQLFESNVVSRKALDEARSAYDLSVAEHAQARARLDLLMSPTPESEVAAAKANIRRKQEELNYSKLQLAHSNIRAPTNGQVVATIENMAVGTYLREGDLFAELADNRIVMAEIEVPETEAKEASIGAPVTLKPWSAPEADIVGTVKRLAPVAEEREFGRVLRVIVEVPNPDGRLSQNMTGFGKIFVDDRPAWEVFTRVLIRFFRIEIWSWLP